MFEEVTSKLKINVLPSFEFSTESPRTDSMRTAALKIRELNPDLVLVITDYDGLATLAKEQVPSIILTSQHLDKAMEFAEADFSNFYAIYPKVYDVEFERRFIENFGEAPKVFAAHGYDAAKALILNKPFSGATGECDPRNVQVCEGVAQVFGVKNGALEVIEH